ncbi:hypothetical protein AA98_2239 [Escherichia coli 2-011-08_S1_C1]|nr:hypothetical protein AA98_2239 [Escherichia coli 2-011-08_S1_C1]
MGFFLLQAKLLRLPEHNEAFLYVRWGDAVSVWPGAIPVSLFWLAAPAHLV